MLHVDDLNQGEYWRISGKETDCVAGAGGFEPEIVADFLVVSSSIAACKRIGLFSIEGMRAQTGGPERLLETA
jgi:hypothetical protein